MITGESYLKTEGKQTITENNQVKLKSAGKHDGASDRLYDVALVGLETQLTRIASQRRLTGSDL